MTIGQRIAQKRKELNLSQEALGAQLGVSRQAIYKWEADAALPEIDKLIALSRRFGVTVGWLLGVEETPPEEPAVPADDGELSERQLQMVEEIVSRYLAAQPKPVSPGWRRLMKLALIAAAVCLVGTLFSLSDKLDQLDSRYTNLQNQIGGINSQVSSQISGITQRVEEVLKTQNRLTADYSAELVARDPARGTATFAPRAVPRTYTEGMTALFQADSGDGPAEFPADLGPGGAFSAEITVPLTDCITISVVFVSPDGTRETQLLDTWTDLYSETLPLVDVDDWMMSAEYRDGKVDMTHQWAVIRQKTDNSEAAAAADLRVGLFRERKLVFWMTEGAPPNGDENSGRRYFYPPLNERVALEPGEYLQFAAVVTDEYGRVTVYDSIPLTVEEDGQVTYMSHFDDSWDVVQWEY